MKRKEREIQEIMEVEEIIRKADVCRLAFANENLPYMVTMNFGYAKEHPKSFYFHCANEGRKLDMIRKNNLVCFEMDTDHQLIRGSKSCDWGMKFSSVIGYGKITIVSAKDEKTKGLNYIMEHYGSKGEQSYDDKILERTTILRLDVTEITGKKK